LTHARWPNLFLVGAAKSGTTSLYGCLSQHPAIFMAPMKEPHYFSRIAPSPELAPFFPHVASRREYLRLFETSGQEPMCGEASTSYLWSSEAPHRIRQVAPDARAIAILRDPVQRAFSHFLNDVREGFETRSFEEAIDDELHRDGPSAWGVTSLYVQIGFYATQLQRFWEVLGRHRVCVLFFEDFVHDPVSSMRRVFQFLGLDPEMANRLSTKKSNPYRSARGPLSARIMGSGMARRSVRRVLPPPLRRLGRAALLKTATKPDLDTTLERRLRSVFDDELHTLEEMLGRRAPWPSSDETARQA
jgi:hypothetical protein